jgi:host factor-I protein
MTNKSNPQELFLNYIRKEKNPVTVFLTNGVKLQGVIAGFDNFAILLKRDGHLQLVYKHAVSTIMPGSFINLTALDDITAEDGKTATPSSTEE